MRLPVDPYLLLYYLDENVLSSMYFRLGFILVATFVFVVLLSLVRKHIFHISLKGATSGFVAGIMVMIVFDLIILFGISDKSKIRDLFTQDKRQQAVSEVMTSGVTNLSKVLGISVAIPKNKRYTKEEILEGMLSLSNEDLKKTRDLLCPQ